MALVGVSQIVHAGEQIVRIETDRGTIVGTLETPGGPPAPVVLLLHTFTGTRDEWGGAFARTADALAKAGYASLRIDFLGSGDSDGAWEDTTVSGQIDDALDAVKWLKNSERVQGDTLAVLGWSQGAGVAAHAADISQDVDALILWAPVVYGMTTSEVLFGKENFEKALALAPSEKITLRLPWGAETTLKGAYFDEIPLLSISAAVAGYDGPMMVFMGDADFLVFPQPQAGQLLVKYHSGPGVLRMLSSGHLFNIHGGPRTLDQQVLPDMIEWLGTALSE